MWSTPLWFNQKILYQLWKSSKPLNLWRRKQQKKMFSPLAQVSKLKLRFKCREKFRSFSCKGSVSYRKPSCLTSFEWSKKGHEEAAPGEDRRLRARRGAGTFLRIPHLIVHMLSDYLRLYLNISRYLFICPSQGECVFFCGRLSISPVCLSGSWLLQTETNKDKLSFLQSHLAWHSF